MQIDSEIFHTYDIRDIYPDKINPEVANRLGWAFAQYLRRDLKKTGPTKVVVAQDMRGSSPFLARELIRGLTDAGIDVIDISRAPTPVLYHTVAFKGYDGGIMVTASHNPKEYNGFKFCREKAFPVSMGLGMEKVRDYAVSSEEQKELSREERGHAEVLDGMVSSYVTQDLSYVNSAKFGRLRIVADTANAMGAMYLDEFFNRIDAEPIKLNWSLNGSMPVHEANPLKEDTLQQIKEVIRNESADLGIATDGDGDRVGFLDEQGETISPHCITAMIAEKLLERQEGAKIGYDLRMSKALKEVIEENGGVAIEMPVGHSHIKSQMKEQDVLFSGELSMHYYFRENYNYDSPVFVIGALLQIRSESGKPFSELWKKYVRYHHSGEVNFSAEGGSASGGEAWKKRVIEELKEKYSDGELSELDGIKISFSDWWFNVRPSNTEPLLRLNLEADTEELMKEKIKEVSKLIKK